MACMAIREEVAAKNKELEDKVAAATAKKNPAAKKRKTNEGEVRLQAPPAEPERGPAGRESAADETQRDNAEAEDKQLQERRERMEREADEEVAEKRAKAPTHAESVAGRAAAAGGCRR